MKTFKEYLLENEDKTYVVLVPGGDPKNINLGSSLMPNDIGTIYKGVQYFISEVYITLSVRFKIKKHPKLKNISMKNYTEPDSLEYNNPRKYAPIKKYEIPYMQLIDIIDIDVYKFRGKLSIPIGGKNWQRSYKFDLPEEEHEFVMGKALHEFTEELKERFKGLCDGTMPLEEPFREKYNHTHEFRNIVKTVINYIQKYNLV